MAAATAPVVTDLPDVPWDRVEKFVGQLTHDIRNGLNALELQLTYLGEISTDPEAIDEIKRIRGSLGSVTRQLQTLRNATGTTTPYPLAYPAREFFDDLRERRAKLATAKTEKITWEIVLPPETTLAVDPELAMSALLELLGNADHFSEDGKGAIRVTVSQEQEDVIFSLAEPQAAAPAISSGDWGRTPLLTTRRGAYGLGLFRVRRCLERQGCALAAAYSTETQLLTTRVTLRGASPTAP